MIEKLFIFSCIFFVIASIGCKLQDVIKANKKDSEK